MPAWCAYREAARKEHLARETAATAEGIAAMGAQAPEFRNSPLTVFGQHDQATVAQMRNCMTVGTWSAAFSVPTATSAMRDQSAA
jgi:tRNA-splicing ligase RtcB